jgi:hypothetical protein
VLAAECLPVPSCTAVALSGGTPDAGTLSDAQSPGGRGNVALLASVGAQLLYLAVHLVEGLAYLGLQPRPAVVGEIP